ncbi:MAG: threonine/serine exporter family protein [Pirellulaceae bacterium]|nr:threonine/serine exporter family protein [Pirellulaceae bacterium]
MENRFQHIELADRQALLIKAASMLHRHGTPAHRMERVMKRVSATLGVEADYLYTPTALLISFAEGSHRTVLRRIDAGEIDLGKLVQFDEALEDLEDGRRSVTETSARIDLIEQSPPRFGRVLPVLAGAVATTCATVFIGGGWREAAFAFVMGALLLLWGALLRRWAPQEHATEITAGFIAALSALFVGLWLDPFDDRTATLGSLIILVPGFSFTVALTELANRHLSSGVARLAGAGVVFLALICGVAIAWRLGSEWRTIPDTTERLVGIWYMLAIGFAPFSFAILFQARVKEWPVIACVAWIGIGVAIMASQWKGMEFGAFLGALALGAAGNFYARMLDRPAMVAQMPGILMLVPGSVGYRSLAAFVENQGLQGIQTAFEMALAAISIVAGLLAANLIVPPKRVL